MKITLILLFLLPTVCFGHDLPQDGLWRGVAIHDKTGKEFRYPRQDFIKVKENSILLFQFEELLSMETGEVHIKTLIDTFMIDNSVSEGSYILSQNEESLKLEIKGEDEIKLVYPKYILTYKKVLNLHQISTTRKEYEDFIIGSTFIEINPETREVTGKYKKSYQTSGKAKYQQVDSNSNWESAFLIVEFEGYVFLKGISSYPFLLTGIENDDLNTLKIASQYPSPKVTLSKSADIWKPHQTVFKTEKPFELKQADISTEDCFSKLSKDQLNLELSIAKGITDHQFMVDQVQHAYDGGWMLFHEKDFDGFGKTTVKKLLEIDPTVCYILDIPEGYYAERKKKEDPWYIYLHEDRITTDSSFIFKKAFLWDNTYRVINEIKNKKLVYYKDYYLDTRILKKTWTYQNSKEVGITRYYNESGKLVKEVNHITGEITNYD